MSTASPARTLLDVESVAFVHAVLVVLSAYWNYFSVSSITTPKLSSLLVLFMTFGTITAMATASGQIAREVDPHPRSSTNARPLVIPVAGAAQRHRAAPRERRR